jgi:signal peptidase I
VTQDTERDKSETTDLVDVAEKTARAVSRESNGRPPNEPSSARRPHRSRLPRTLLTVLLLALLMVLVPAFVARVYAIPSGSMETTLHGCTGCTNDRVLVDKVTYRFSQPHQGSVVVFVLPDSWHNSELTQAPRPTSGVGRGIQSISELIGLQGVGQTDLIKRVIAVGGQTVSCCDSRNRVLVDGKPIDEPYVYFAPDFGPARQSPFAPVRVPPGDIWVMGDSRNNSVDSRAPGDGPVPLSNVIGKARLIVYPFARFTAIGSGTSHPAG